MSGSPHHWRYLATNPKSAYKQDFIKGTRIRAPVLYGLYKSQDQGPTDTIEEIAQMYNLPVDAVQEAVDYCESNSPELFEDYAREDANAEASGENDPNDKYNPKPKLLSPEDLARLYGPKG
jgi:uncharacterized protein (DUF433 family)